MIRFEKYDVVIETKNGTLKLSQMIPFGVVNMLGIGYLCVFLFTDLLPTHPALWLFVPVVYTIGMLGVTIGYHRYFSHHAFKTSRVFQFILAWWAQTSAQKSMFWWAANHQHHHRTSDTPEDIHSVLQQGFGWAHVWWILSTKSKDVSLKRIKRKFPKEEYPELYWLERWHLVPPIAYASTVLLVSWIFSASFLFALSMLGFACFIPLLLLYHGTFTINSIAHVWGRKRYDTKDESKNNIILALITMGEGWHNNHHKYPYAAAQGMHWWQIDIAYLVILFFERLRIISDVRKHRQLPPS